jgi:GxxExxY protein
VSMSAYLKSEHAYQVIGSCIQIHRRLGPGLFESVYDACLARELAKRGVPFERQVEIAIVYDGERVGPAFRADLIVGGTLLVELKSVEKLHPLHNAQVLTYLRLSGLPQGLLVNFNVPVLRHGIKSFLGPSAREIASAEKG